MSHKPSDHFNTDVLVIGAGPMGATTALALARMGIDVRMVTMYGWVAHTPRAHITSQRTMEVLRDLGVEDEVKRVGTPWELMGDTPLAVSLIGPEIARMPSWGAGVERHGDYVRNSPCTYLDVPQPRMEPIIVAAAAAEGAKVFFNTEFLRLEQDDEGVTAWVRDLERDEEYRIRARYLVGADGARSQVAEQIGLPIEGHVARAGTVYTQFRADLTKQVAHRPSILNWFLTPEAGFGEIGLGLLRAVTPWTEWISGWGFDMAAGEPDMSHEHLKSKIRILIGDPTIDIDIVRASTWYVNQQYALEYGSGRVFCGGDATHRHPPSSGLGLNTCIQDGHNLAWKLAYVLKGYAGLQLLDSYTAERAPVGKQIVLRANQSRLDYAALRACFTMEGDGDPVQNALDRLHAPTPEGVALRQQLDDALTLKETEWNAEGVEKNQRYVSNAVMPEPDAEPEQWLRDPEVFAQVTTRPGAKIPHAWLVDETGRRISTLDITGKGRFTVVTGLAGIAWEDAANRLGLEFLHVALIGRGGMQDLYYAWHRIRDVEDAGALLVRPDGFVAWRHRQAVWDLEEASVLLKSAIASVLARAT